MADKKVNIIITGKDQTKAALSSVQNGFNKVGSALRGVGTKLTAGLTLPIVALGTKIATVAADFESSMNVLSIAARSAGTGMEDLQAAAIAVGGDTRLVGINAADAALAMTDFYKAGLDTTEIFGDLNSYLKDGTELSGALRAAIDLQAASELELAEASDVVSIAMATFGLSADDAVGIADNFVRTADASVASVGELAAAMVNIGPTAAAFGYTLEDTNVALAILSQRGIKGAEAGTALKSMMTNLMRPTESVQAKLQMLNVSLFDQNNELKSLPSLIGELGTAMGKLTEKERLEAIQVLAGTYGMKAMNTLLAEGVVGWEDMESAIGDAASVQESAAARTKGMAAAWETLQGVIETFMIKVGLPLIQDVLTPLVRDNIIPLFEWLSALDPKFIKWGIAIAGVLAVAGPFALALGAILPIIGALVSPIGLVIAGIAALVALFIKSQGGIQGAANTLSNMWETLKAFGSGIVETIQGAFASLWAIIAPVVESLGAFLAEKWALMSQVFSAAWERIQGIANMVVSAVSTFIQEKVGQATDFFSVKFHGIIVWFEQNMPLIQATISAVMGFVQTTIREALDVIVAIWNWAWPHIQTILNGVWENIKIVVSTAIGVVEGIIKTIMQMITGDWEGAWTTIKDTAAIIWDGIKNAIMNTLNTILGLFNTNLNDLLAAIADKIGAFIEGGKSIVQGIVNGIKAAPGKIKDALMGIVKNAWSSVLDFFGIGSPSKVGIEFGKNLATSIGKGYREEGDNLTDIMVEASKRTVKGYRSQQTDMAASIAASTSGSIVGRGAIRQTTSAGGGGGGGIGGGGYSGGGGDFTFMIGNITIDIPGFGKYQSGEISQRVKGGEGDMVDLRISMAAASI